MELNFENLEIDELQGINGGKVYDSATISRVVEALVNMVTHPNTVLNSGVPSKRPI